MSEHAHYAIIENGQRSFYDSRWGAPHIQNELLGGSEDLLELLRTDNVHEPIDMFEPEVAEAGLLLDMDRKYLLWCGNDMPVLEVFSLRQLYLKLIQPHWQDWTIQWADEGPLEIARALGLDLETLCTGDQLRLPTCEVASLIKAVPPGTAADTLSLMSLRDRNGTVKHYLFAEMSSGLLLQGPGLIDKLRTCVESPFPKETYTPWMVSDAPTEERKPVNGVFLDVANQELWWWSSGFPFRGDLVRLAELWPRWTVRVHTSGLVRHAMLACVDQDIRMPKREAAQIVQQWLESEGSEEWKQFLRKNYFAQHSAFH